VVERPASVVKELLENAIDAGSHRIEIDIDRGGSALIRITDDGEGISKTDLVLAVSRHATSKLATLNELEHISSLGFRGEALASISAVSRLSIQSKTAEQHQAWMINTGTDTDFTNYQARPEPVACAEGTTIEVRDLFFNTPARRKFMRTAKTEFKHIDDVFKRIALSRFDIAFKLSHNKKMIRNLPVSETAKAIEQRISKVFSADFLTNSNHIDVSSSHFSQMGTIRLWGWVSQPHWHRNQPDWQYFYVNGRYIRDKLINHALRQACQELLPPDCYLSYLLYLEIDPGQVDVNVHPTKHEVRFRQTRLVHDFIYSALNQSLQASQPSSIASLDVSVGTGITEPENFQGGGDKTVYTHPYAAYRKDSPVLSRKDVADQLEGMHNLYQANQSLDAQAGSRQTGEPKKNSFGRSLGVLIPGYILSQKVQENGQVQLFMFASLVIQQFLLAQRFQYGKSVNLLIPETLTLAPEKIEQIMSLQGALQNWGLDISSLSDNMLLIRSLPALQDIPALKINPYNLMSQIAEISAVPDPQSLQSKLTEILLSSLETEACSLPEQTQLLSLLSAAISTLDPIPSYNKQALWLILDENLLADWFRKRTK